MALGLLDDEMMTWLECSGAPADDPDVIKPPIIDPHPIANAPDPKKRPRLSLKLKRKPLSAATNTAGAGEASRPRFGEPVSDVRRDMAAKGVIPANTDFSTKWAVNTFMTWATQRNERLPNDDPVPRDLLECTDAGKICKFLCLFALETRRENGKPYPPASIRSLLSGLNRVLRANNAPFSILDKGDVRFLPLLNTMDTVSSELHREGVGVERKSAGVISPEDEEKMWQEGAFGLSPPKVLQQTVFFYLHGHAFRS